MDFIVYNNITNLGYIPGFVDKTCKDDAVTQIHRNYTHGGGWRDLIGYQIYFTENGRAELKSEFECDLPFMEIARGVHGRDLVFVFECCIVAVVDTNNNLRVARID